MAAEGTPDSLCLGPLLHSVFRDSTGNSYSRQRSRIAAFPRHAAGVGRHPDLWVPSHILYTSDDERRHGKCEMMKRAFMDNNHASCLS